jgi:hypothetical protein
MCSCTCFILQIIYDEILKNYIYKIIYINNINDNFIQKEYEYKNTYYPSNIYITINSNDFIIEHDEIEGNEHILINRETGEYEVIETIVYGGHKKWQTCT